MAKRIPLVDKEHSPIFLRFGADDKRVVKVLELIGEGSSCLIYKAEIEDANQKRICVVKEYYPDDEYIYDLGTYYYREKVGQPLLIKADSDRDKDLELTNQINNINRELRNNQQLFYDDQYDNSNNPYMYPAYKILGDTQSDTSYLVMETSEGKTLLECLKTYGSNGMDIQKAINYTKRLLEIVRYMSNKGFVHGDIALDNIWITGNNQNEYVLLLDYGSAFNKSDYLIIDEKNENEIIQMADTVLCNVSLGSSHENTRSGLIIDLLDAKECYGQIRSLDNAKRLLSTLGKVDIRVDIHSCIKILFLLIANNPFNGSMDEHDLANILYGDSKTNALTSMLLSIMKKNDDLYCDSLIKAFDDLQELEDIVGGKCSPESLLLALQKEVNKENIEHDIRLFVPIMIKDQQ